MSAAQRLGAALELGRLPALAAALCAHLGGAFELASALREERVTTELRQGGHFTVEVKRLVVTDGEVTVSAQGESGDNGARDSRAWEGWFHAEAAITGLPGGVALRFTGDGWGGHTVEQVAVESGEAAALLAFIKGWMEAEHVGP
jgi:hypothetical protein